ncbi:hypothetical protein JG688_00018499, partial [Phytophthora aleatoria]
MKHTPTVNPVKPVEIAPIITSSVTRTAAMKVGIAPKILSISVGARVMIIAPTGVTDTSQPRMTPKDALPRTARTAEARTEPPGVTVLTVDVNVSVATRDKPVVMIATKAEMSATVGGNTDRAPFVEACRTPPIT